ncbi:MAG TPA: hypothetical protein VFA71_14820 [Terriglobales bacterium]|nr:hypothetical protein [Terriglobales bacterium]
MKARFHVLLAMVLCLGLALLYIAYLEPMYPTSEAGRRLQVQIPGVAGRGAIDDEADYISAAKNIVEGHGYSLDSIHPTAIRQPLYSIYLAPFFRTFGESVNTALMANACLLALLPLLAFLITGALLDREAAVLSAYLCAFDPAFYFFGAGQVYAEALFAVLLCGGMALWLHARREGFTYPMLASAGAGLLLGAAALTRSGFLVFPLLLCAGEIFFWRRKKLKAALVLCAAALICIVPWALRNERALGAPVVSSTNDGTTLLGTALAAADGRGDWENPASLSPEYDRLQHMPDEIARNRQTRELALAKLREIPPAKLAKVAVLRVARTWVPYTRLVRDENGRGLNLLLTAVFFPVMLFGMIGVAGVLTERCRLYSAAPILLTILYFTALAAAAWGSTRFRMPLEPVLVGFAASGIFWGWNVVAGRIGSGCLSSAPKLMPESSSSETRARAS